MSHDPRRVFAISNNRDSFTQRPFFILILMIFFLLISFLSNVHHEWFQVAWLRVESKTILTIHHHIITRNYRIGLSHSDDKHWNLHISDVQESDRGGYMCKYDTSDPIKQFINHDSFFSLSLSLVVNVLLQAK